MYNDIEQDENGRMFTLNSLSLLPLSYTSLESVERIPLALLTPTCYYPTHSGLGSLTVFFQVQFQHLVTWGFDIRNSCG